MKQNGESSRRLGQNAVVLGGSIAGLCTARVLSDFFDRVTLVERDVLGDDAEPRKGVPQGRHAHGLLRGGQDILDGWFPGLTDALIRGGAPELEFGTDFQWFHGDAWKASVASGVMGVGMSRPFLEAEVRRRVLAIENVRRLDGHDVLGVTTDASRTRVTGATVRDRDGEKREVTLDAELVVDATGRGSQTPRWLDALGRERPPVSTVEIDVCYASRMYAQPPAGSFPWKGCYVLGKSPASRRMGLILPVEGGRWMTVVGGLLGDHPPDDEAGFLAFAKSLPNPAIWNAFNTATPLGDVVRFKFPSHLRRHYDRVRDLPDGLVVLGDAHCSFNPIYGQGMTAAALGVRELERNLAACASRRGGLHGLSARFQRDLARVIDGPWKMSTSEDLRYPEVKGERPFGHGIMQWYVDQVHRAASRDPQVTREFYRVMHLLAPMSTILRPGFVRRVLSAQALPPAAPYGARSVAT
jgi:2-polyprenyl-6-methoxyphenol hydroxylase-like FAD-dependent oxidoreductase